MLNKEQTDYIDSLRITHPSLPEATLKPLFVEAGWSAEEITEALTRYTKVPVSAPVPATPPQPPEPKETIAPRPQASPAKLSGAVTPVQKPLAATQKTGGIGKVILTIGILLIIGAIIAGAYFYLIQKGHIDEVMRTGDIIFKSILDKI